MASIDLDTAQYRARRAYELARVQRAVVGFAPVLVVVAIAAILGVRPALVLALGGLLYVLGTVLLWRGQDLGRAVLPGVVAGLLPLSLALCAKHMGHACVGGACMTVCLPACCVGGVGAGLLMAWFGSRRQRSAWFWGLASAVTVLTGALGCLCVGLAGVAGLAGGYALGLAPGALRAALRERAPKEQR